MALDKDGKTELPKNIYWLPKKQLYIVDKTYKGIRIVEYAKKLKGKDSAIEILRDRMYEIDHGLYTGKVKEKPKENEDSEKMKLNDAFELYLSQWKPQLKRSTKRTYRQEYGINVAPILGDKYLEDITDEDIDNLYNIWVKKKYMQGTFDANKKILNAVINAAVKKKIIKFNPMKMCEPPKNLEQKKSRVLTEEERDIFLKYAKDTWYYEYFVANLYCGCRTGEMTGLCEDSVNYARNEIYIRRNLQYDKDGFYIETPKTQESQRVVDLLPEVKEAIEGALKKRDKVWSTLGKDNIPEEFRNLDFIFVNSKGGLITKGTLTICLNTIVRRINKESKGYARINPHALRHTFATLGNEAGINIFVLSETLGHKSIDTTRRYVGVNRNFRKSEMSKLSKVKDT